MSDALLVDDIDKQIDKPRIPFNIPKAINLRIKKRFTYQEIADHFNISRQAAHKRLRRFASILDNVDSLGDYNKIKSDMLSAAEIKLIEKIVDPVTLKEASLNNAAYAFKEINNANRLEKDKSTSNIGVIIEGPEEHNLRAIAHEMAMKAIKAIKEVEEDNTPEAVIEPKI